MTRSLLALSLIVAPVAVQAQQAEFPASLPEAESSDDIIVQGLRIPREKLPTAVYWNYQSMLGMRIMRENAQMFMRCALKSTDRRWLRKVVDGDPNGADARFAQGQISQTHRGCYPPDRSFGMMVTRFPIGAAEVGESRLDRGVIVEQVLADYAPHAMLTPEMTGDPTVKSRFRQREGVRNRLRLPDDRDALIFASCLVEQQPVLATRLFRSMPGTSLERGLTQAIIVQGRVCVGNANRVTIDPSLARTYIIDAFYRWVVAARGVDSLIVGEPDVW
jgi:hypothetical protein